MAPRAAAGGEVAKGRVPRVAPLLSPRRTPTKIGSSPHLCSRSDQRYPRELRNVRAVAKSCQAFPLAPQIHFGARPFVSAQGRMASFAASAFPARHKKSSGTASKTSCDDPKKQSLDLGEGEYFLCECRWGRGAVRHRGNGKCPPSRDPFRGTTLRLRSGQGSELRGFCFSGSSQGVFWNGVEDSL